MPKADITNKGLAATITNGSGTSRLDAALAESAAAKALAIANEAIQVAENVKDTIGAVSNLRKEVDEKITAKVSEETNRASEVELTLRDGLAKEVVTRHTANRLLEKTITDTRADLEEQLAADREMSGRTVTWLSNLLNDEQANREVGDSALDAKLEKLDESLYTETTETELIDLDINIQQGAYLQSSGNQASDNIQSLISDFVDISAYDKLYITARAQHATTAYVFYDANKTTGTQSVVAMPTPGPTARELFDEEVAVPEGYKYIRVCTYPHTSKIIPKIKIKKPIVKFITDTVADAVDTVSKLNTLLETGETKSSFISIPVELTKQDTYIIRGTGKEVTTAGCKCTDFIYIGDYKKIQVSVTYSAQVAGWTIYNADKHYVRASNTEASTKPVVITDQIIELQPNEKYIRLSPYPSTTANCKAVSLKYEVISPLTLADKVKLLDDEISGIDEKVTNLKTTNVLFGKKYISCGDSFTEGDFSGYVDSEGHSGKNSTELYDTTLKMYKTYPYWIAKRNGMTLINEAKCGSVLPYSAEYTGATTFTTTYLVSGDVATVYVSTLMNVADWDYTADTFSYKGTTLEINQMLSSIATVNFVADADFDNKTSNPIKFTATERIFKYRAESWRSPFVLNRLQTIPEDADYITLCFGLNEGLIDIGKITDGGLDKDGNIVPENCKTCYGAYNSVMEWLIMHRPWAKIGIIIPDAWYPATGHDMQVAVAKRWGIPYLDTRADANIPMGIGGRLGTEVCSRAISLRNAQYYVASSNGHPNLKAHQQRSTYIENFLRSL